MPGDLTKIGAPHILVSAQTIDVQQRSIKSVLEFNVLQKEAKIARHASRKAKSVASRACWHVPGQGKEKVLDSPRDS